MCGAGNGSKVGGCAGLDRDPLPGQDHTGLAGGAIVQCACVGRIHVDLEWNNLI